jgi:DNA-binding beta-propeller fold protein YncE
VLSGANTDDLLYASNRAGYGPNGVFVFSYKQGKQVGFLSGFPATVEGLCTDKAGDVFVVTNSYRSSGENYIYEYSHGASEPSATLDDDYGDPFGCAVDPTTGNLAVTNPIGGNVAVYKDATGSPSIYSDASYITSPNFCAYDENGNLYIDDQVTPDDRIAELPAGSSGLFTNITLSQYIDPESLQWEKNRLVMSGAGGGVTHGPVKVYKAQISGQAGTVSGPIYLSGPRDRKAPPYVQFWIQRGSIAGPAWTHDGDGRIDLWNWPRGGEPTKTLHAKGASGFVGVAVSLAVSSK